MPPLKKAGVEIRTSAEVIGAGSEGDLHFTGAHSEKADLAIGADGVWSMVRRSLGLELFHQQTDEGALRAIIPGTPDDLGQTARASILNAGPASGVFLSRPSTTGKSIWR